MEPEILDLVLFVRNPSNVTRAVDAGIQSFMVDMEWRGKHDRQDGADTEIDPATAADLEIVTREAGQRGARVFCRINRFGPWTGEEVGHAVECGVARIFLPMVTAVGEVEEFLGMVDGRCETAILVETEEGVANAADIARLPLGAVYIGLNDLAISRGASNIFPPLIDGTIPRMRDVFAGREFGFGGVTSVDGGWPLPCRMLLQEMARLQCGFSFLRRSFMSDLWPRPDLAQEIERVRAYLRLLAGRDNASAMADHARLHEAVSGLLVPEPAK
jgi:hypothetical protein